MTQDEFYDLILSPAYDFLRTDPHLGENIMFLTLGGATPMAPMSRVRM